MSSSCFRLSILTGLSAGCVFTRIRIRIAAPSPQDITSRNDRLTPSVSRRFLKAHLFADAVQQKFLAIFLRLDELAVLQALQRMQQQHQRDRERERNKGGVERDA